MTALPFLELSDVMRRAQGHTLGLLGFDPRECAHRVVAATSFWCLRDYRGPDAGHAVLIVAAPIKRPYIWDLAPAISPVRLLLKRGLHVYLLEWKPPPFVAAADGLAMYADQAIAASVAWITEWGGRAPFLIGHSLGGTLAAIYAALEPRRIRGLVLLGAPLCFQPHASTFRDAINVMAPLLLMQATTVPGSALSHLSALASPGTFIWSRLIDEISSSGDHRAAEIFLRVERWALDEVAVDGLLMRQVVQWLYQQDRLCRGTLRLGKTTVGPAMADVPALAVVNAADEIAPRACVQPFLSRMPGPDVSLLEFPGETRVGLQHLALLVGPRAHAEVWAAIGDWIDARR